MSHALHGTFISEKINRVRWRPDAFNDSHFFLTGSVDNDLNSIKLWDFVENDEDDVCPFLVSTYNYSGDVTEIKFINADYFVSSSSSGSADLLKIVSSIGNHPEIKSEISWENLHTFKIGESSPCTSLTVYDNDIVTVGEDGCINLLNTQSPKVIRKIDNADSCSIHCVIFSKHNEVLTSNLRGQLKIWDLRSEQNHSTSTFMLSGDEVTPTCLTYHPTQRHLILAGDELGSLTTWDLRHNTYPVNVLNAHDGAVSELKFHPDRPDQLFSCSSTGQLWHWFSKSRTISSSPTVDGDMSVWFTPEDVRSKLEVFTLMPTLGKSINSLDLNRNRVICGCDNEAVYLISGVNL